MTAEEMQAYKLTASDREDLKRLAVMPDDRIDTSDIPIWEEGKAGRACRISIRLNDSDIVEAQILAADRGTPYQTCIRMLLHEAIQRERSAA